MRKVEPVQVVVVTLLLWAGALFGGALWEIGRHLGDKFWLEVVEVEKSPAVQPPVVVTVDGPVRVTLDQPQKPAPASPPKVVPKPQPKARK